MSWRVPQSAGAASIDRYKVVRWAQGLPKKAFKFAPSKRSARITGLIPGTKYSFNVSAHNARGWGEPSATVTARPLAIAGFGRITGTCGRVLPQLDESAPSLFRNTFDFRDDPYDEEDVPELTPGAQEIHAAPNTGGSSLLSEMFAFETLARCEQGSLLKTETEIVYDQAGKIADLLIDVSGDKVGISVVRSVTYPFGNPPIQGNVVDVLTQKLEDIQEASQNVSKGDAWVKPVLVVMAYDEAHAQANQDAWLGLDAETKADTVVYVITTDGSDACMYDSTAC